MPYKQRIFKEGRQKLFFENQSIPLDDMMSIPVPDFPRLREKDVTWNCFIGLVIDCNSSLTFCYESNIIIVESVDSTFSQELLHICQFDDINQKFTAILILVKSISGNRVLHYRSIIRAKIINYFFILVTIEVSYSANIIPSPIKVLPLFVI